MRSFYLPMGGSWIDAGHPGAAGSEGGVAGRQIRRLARFSATCDSSHSTALRLRAQQHATTAGLTMEAIEIECGPDSGPAILRFTLAYAGNARSRLMLAASLIAAEPAVQHAQFGLLRRADLRRPPLPKSLLSPC